MANEERVDQRPKCDWNPRDPKTGLKGGEPCGSEKGVRPIERDYGFGRTKENICEKHILDAWKKFRNPDMPPSDLGGSRK